MWCLGTGRVGLVWESWKSIPLAFPPPFLVNPHSDDPIRNKAISPIDIQGKIDFFYVYPPVSLIIVFSDHKKSKSQMYINPKK